MKLNLVMFGCAATLAVCAAPLEIGQVRCEDAINPMGTADAWPRLSWNLRGDEPPMRPAGAEVRVAADAAALQSAAVRRTDNLFSWVYDGPALRPGVPYWWQVRLVNADGSSATPWSAPGRFVVALQDGAQWAGARWIGEEPVRVDWQDIDYQVKFSRVTNAFGVFFRARSGAEGYMWQVNFERAAARLRPHVFLPGGKGMRLLPEKDLSPFFPKGLDPAAAHALKISLRGETIKTFIDGTLVDERTDATFKAGTVGVRTSYAEDALVREVDVRTADGAVLLHDTFNGHVMQAFRNPRTEKGGLRVAGAVYLHPGILPKSCPRLRRTFTLADKPIASAIASACGMGFYELWLNGKKADPTRVLAPGMTQPSRALLFDTYDVTALLRPGAENAVGFWLAAGYSDDFSRYGWHWLKPKCAILHLLIRYADGTEQTVVTDGTWQFNPSSPVTYASIYQGETYDASLEDPGWCLPGASAAGWRPAVLSEGMEQCRLLANDEPPVRMLDPRKPLKIVETEPGVFTVDFGQNRAGFVEARVRGPKGTTVSIRTSELLGDDGKIDPWTNAGARSTDTFVLAGTGAAEKFVPRFTYHGFRYVEIRGWPGRPAADDLTAWAVHADVETAGAFRCSNETLNRFFGAALWSMRSNFMSYPTDCDMRVERTPCQMDSQAYEDAALAFFNMTRYYAKWLDDIRGGRGNPDWTGDSVTLAARLWRETGDARVYAARYDDMKGQVDAFVKRAPDLVCRSGFGDWCAPNKGTWESYFNDVAIVNTSIFCEMARIVAEAAHVLGKDEDAARYDALHARAKEAFHRQFYDAKAHAYGDGSQTTAVLPLAFGIVPADCRAAVADQLLRTIREKNGGRVDTGIFGTRYLGDVLCDLGEGDLFVHMLTQPEYPGFGYMLAKGATTLWEQWSFKCGMNSHNHAMFAGAASTLMTRLGGIRPKAPGYAEIEICPTFPKSLDWAEATRETPRGRVAVKWRRAGENVELDVEVPPFTPAVLRVPGAKPRPLAPGLQRVTLADGRFIDVSPVAPRYFCTEDGRAWIPIGCNICFDRLYGTEGNDRATCEARYFVRMRAFAANGGNFLRIWLGHPFFEVMPSRAGEYDPAAEETLKKTVRLAEELGIKIKFTLESFRSVLPPDKVGKGMYSAFFNRPLYAPYAGNMRAFYASQECFGIYLGKARYLKSLGLGDSPAVICWELWNEINATGPLEAYEDWSNRMLDALDALFPRQMVVQNLGSFSGAGAFRIYDYLGRVKANAFMQAHRYLDLGAELDVCRGPVDVLSADAVRELLDRRPDRPALLAEVGAVRANHTGPSDLYDLDAKGMLLHDEIFAPFFAGSAGCGQPWHWDHQYLDRHGLWHHFGRFAKAVEGLDPVAEDFRPFRTETKNLRVYGLKGRRTTVLWCRDKANTWEAEYRRGIAPQTLEGAALPFNSQKGFSVYLPWEDRSVALPAGPCKLPPFQRSCVVRF